MRCDGMVVLVTGGQQGIGRAIALALAREGADVVPNYLDDPDAAANVAKDIREAGRRCLAVQGVLRQRRGRPRRRRGAWRRSGRHADQQCGHLSSLAVPRPHRGRVGPCARREPQGQLPHRASCTPARRPGRAGRHRQPRLVRGLPEQPAGHHYVASKAGVVGLTRAMALELARHGIRVNAIAPGLTDTAQPRDGHSEAELQAMARQVPLGRMGQPDDVAAVAVFLASPDARHVNGGAYLG